MVISHKNHQQTCCLSGLFVCGGGLEKWGKPFSILHKQIIQAHFNNIRTAFFRFSCFVWL